MTFLEVVFPQSRGEVARDKPLYFPGNHRHQGQIPGFPHSWPAAAKGPKADICEIRTGLHERYVLEPR